MIQVGNTLTFSKKDALVTLLIELKEVFAWSYEDMPRIDTDIVQTLHSNKSNQEACQAEIEKNKPKWSLKIKEEVKK